MHNEIPLEGGTTRPVVRVGETVRRHTGDWSSGVHALLLHLESVGYDGAPRFLGLDDIGREVLTFIPGDVTANKPVDGQHSKQSLTVAAEKLRDYHRAALSFSAPSNARWRIQPGAPTVGSIICHNDLGPHNTIYQSGIPHAFIDWDFAAPSSPLWDVTYAAWLFVPLFNSERARQLGWPEANVVDRLVTFCNAYGLENRSDFVETLLERQQVTHDLFVEWGTAGITGFPNLLKSGRDKGVLRDMEFTRQNAEQWQSALDKG